MNKVELLSSILSEWAERKPNDRALVYLDNGQVENEALLYAELHNRAGQIARVLKEKGLVGERVLLLYPSGIEYVTAFLGCLYAGVIAIPVYPPRNNYHAERVSVIAQDSSAKAALTSSDVHHEVFSRIHSTDFGFAGEVITLPNPDQLSEMQPWINEEVIADQAAYLQYTSGSTGDPKGVIVRHSDLTRNCRIYGDAIGLSNGPVIVSWLPLFHDLGLVQGIVLPLVLGGTSVFMPSVAFIDRPIRWLQAISHYKGQLTAAPNFAYQLCVDKINDEELQTLDLSSWRIALNGAEPIDADTLSAFASKFRKCGLHEHTMIGGYGLAEATLFVTFGRMGQHPPILHVDKQALERNLVITLPESSNNSTPLVSSGRTLKDPEVRIVNPDNGLICNPNGIGEIWVSGSSICAGYWKRPDVTSQIFQATLPDDPDRSYLRTGDLGFVHNGELYVTGRLKDLIIVRGSNHYPQDIEKTVEGVSPMLRKGGWGAAFTLDEEGVQKLVVVQEVERTARRRIEVELIGRVTAQAIAEAHGIDLDLIVFVEPGNVPKTSSGKIQRKACKQRLIDSSLREIGRWTRPASNNAMIAKLSGIMRRQKLDRSAVVQWLREMTAAVAGLSLDDIWPDRSFAACGLSSLRTVELAAEISSAFGVSLPTTMAFDYPTISLLADYLTGEVEGIHVHSEPYEPIAIVGIDCRFPQAEGVQAFWQLLLAGEGTISELSDERRQLTGYTAGSSDSHRWVSFLTGIEQFDASLFGISPREAESMDPQQRMLLETAWRALESSNIAPDSLRGSNTGVFIGLSSNDYFRLGLSEGASLDAYAGTGSAMSIAANRVSYCLGLQGPSMVMDTACSSSLVAVHQACKSLALGESSIALAGGSNLVLTADYGQIFSQAGMLSPTGSCHTFDDEADGYVRGEGVGMIVLKRLTDAQRDNNTILAVIRGSAINQDGSSNGLTAPNGLAQQRVIDNALQSAGITGTSIGYVETHGTGTPLGDPIEVRSLRTVLDGISTDGNDATPCWLGAVKTNIGHLEAAAGIAGLIKSVLVLQHGIVPRNRGYRQLNRHIDLNGSRLRIPSENVEWERPSEHPRRAGVSSFGFGGTNAHIVLEAFESSLPLSISERKVEEGTQPGYLLALSAQSENSLHALALQYADVLERTGDAQVEALCRTASTARAKLPERLAIVGESADDLVGLLRQFKQSTSRNEHGAIRGRARQLAGVAFLFTGQGAQYAGMGRELYNTEPVFRQHIELCDELLSGALNGSIREMMFGEQTHYLDDTQFAQPAIAVLQTALVEQWKHWGVMPEYAIGHSVGEYAAAYAAGVMDLATVMNLVTERGRLMSTAPGQGMMATANASVPILQEYLGELYSQVDLAAVNGPEQTVLSGRDSIVLEALSVLERHNIRTTKLNVSHAFHSRLMDAVLEPFRSVFDGIRLNEPRLKLVLTGGEPTDNPADSEYWVNQIRRPVLFAEGMKRLALAGANIFVEIGPSSVLLGLGRRSIDQGLWVPSLKAGEDERMGMLSSLGELFVHGVPAQLKHVFNGNSMTLSAAPLYPFDREAHWFNRQNRVSGASPSAAMGESLPLLGQRLDLASDDMICFTSVLPDQSVDYLLDHRVVGRSIMPGAGYVGLAIAAAEQAGLTQEGKAVDLKGVRFNRPLDLTESVSVQTILSRKSDDINQWRVQIMARTSDSGRWESYAETELHAHIRQDLQVEATHESEELTSVTAQKEKFDTERLYEDWSKRGIDYGTRFRAVTLLERYENSIKGIINLPDGVNEWKEGLVHPVLLDAAFQTLGAALLGLDSMGGRVPLPAAIESIAVYRKWTTPLHAIGYLREEASEEGPIVADIVLSDAEGRIVAKVHGLQAVWVDVQRTTAMNSSRAAQEEIPFYFPVWSSDAPVIAASARRNEGGKVVLSSDETVWCLYPSEAEQLAQSIGTFYDADKFMSIMFDGHVLHSASGPITMSNEVDLDQWIGIMPVPDRIYFLGGMHNAAEWDADNVNQALARSQQQGVISLFRLLKSLIRCGFEHRSLHFHNVTNGVYEVVAQDVIQPFGAETIGFLKSAARELRDWSICSTDIGAMDLISSAEGFHLIAEAIVVRPDDGSELAVRDGNYHRRSLHPIEFTETVTSPLRERGVYVIVGGGGGIGQELAQYMARTAKARLVLIGRSPLRDKEREMIRSLEQLGAEALYLQADVSDESSLRDALRQGKERFGCLNGVIHSAVVLRDKAIRNMDEQMLVDVLAPKAAGSLNLYRSVSDESLDFLLYFSSAQSFFGNAGQANYAAASTFQDAYALAAARYAAFPVNTVNWGYWGEVGVAADEHYRERIAAQGIGAIMPEEGMQAVCRSLAVPSGQILAIKASQSALIAMGVSTSDPDQGVNPVMGPAEIDSADELAAMPDEEMTSAIIRNLKSMVGEVLRINAHAKYPDDDVFGDLRLTSLGVDSLMAMELRTKIRNWVGVDVPAHLFIGDSRIIEVIQLIRPKILLLSLSTSGHMQASMPEDEMEELIL